MNHFHYTRKNARKELLGYRAWPDVYMRGWRQAESSEATSMRQAIADYLDRKRARFTPQALAMSHVQLRERANRRMAPHPRGRTYAGMALTNNSFARVTLIVDVDRVSGVVLGYCVKVHLKSSAHP